MNSISRKCNFTFSGKKNQSNEQCPNTFHEIYKHNYENYFNVLHTLYYTLHYMLHELAKLHNKSTSNDIYRDKNISK